MGSGSPRGRRKEAGLKLASYLAVHTSHAQGGAAGSLLGLIRPKSRRHMAGPSRSRAQLLLRAHSYPGRVLFLVVGLPTPFPRWLPLGVALRFPRSLSRPLLLQSQKRT